MSPLQVGKAQEMEAVEEGRIMICSGCRDQLRTDEAVTRLANFLHNDDVGETLNEHEKSCRITGCEERTLYKNYARAAITALLGNSDND